MRAPAFWLAGIALLLPLPSAAQVGSPARPLPGAAASAAAAAPAPPRIPAGDPRPLLRSVPVVLDRLRPGDIGLVVNTRDPYSMAVGEYYAAARGLRPEQILEVDLPLSHGLTAREFEALQQAIDAHFGWSAQALALAWVAPYAVNCNSLGGALALGYDEKLCQNSCGFSRESPYANASTARPYTELRLRPSMHLAARSVEEARALIDRGVRADGLMSRPGAPPADALFVSTADAARNVRSALYPGARPAGVRGVRQLRTEGLASVQGDRLLLVSIGLAVLPALPTRGWLPGALADHLTSVGGDLLGQHGQSSALVWISAGATASHGAVSEPCNHLHKFPHPQWLLGHYAQGSTALEAYWKSVLWPQQSVFVGEPLAAPFAPLPSPPLPSPALSSTPLSSAPLAAQSRSLDTPAQAGRP